MLELKNISKTYGAKTALSDVSVAFPEKGLVIVCGESGSLRRDIGRELLYRAPAQIRSTERFFRIGSLRSPQRIALYHIPAVFHRFRDRAVFGRIRIFRLPALFKRRSVRGFARRGLRRGIGLCGDAGSTLTAVRHRGRGGSCDGLHGDSSVRDISHLERSHHGGRASSRLARRTYLDGSRSPVRDRDGVFQGPQDVFGNDSFQQIGMTFSFRSPAQRI